MEIFHHFRCKVSLEREYLNFCSIVHRFWNLFEHHNSQHSTVVISAFNNTSKINLNFHSNKSICETQIFRYFTNCAAAAFCKLFIMSEQKIHLYIVNWCILQNYPRFKSFESFNEFFDEGKFFTFKFLKYFSIDAKHNPSKLLFEGLSFQRNFISINIQ